MVTSIIILGFACLVAWVVWRCRRPPARPR